MTDKLMMCALLSQAAYSATVPNGLGVVGFEHIVDTETDTYGMAYITEDSVIIAFRGSESRKDWLNDFKIIKTEFFGVRAHRGFAMCAGSVLTQAEAMIRAFPEKQVVITGHSLGGAIATLIAVALRPRKVELITFGQPRVSTERELKLALYGDYLRIVNGSDVVPRSPWLGYGHAGTCLYLANSGKHLIDPSKTRMFVDRLATITERATAHSMGGYIAELNRCS